VDVVAVPGLAGGVFPSDAKSMNWARARHELRGPLRGDRDDLPALSLNGATDRKEVNARLLAHHRALVERHAEEERRLAYVALARAKAVLLTSGYVWDTAQKPRDPSPFLVDVRPFANEHE
jgi:DNA helicase II / ATP-dependent DNA helicase PcrA